MVQVFCVGGGNFVATLFQIILVNLAVSCDNVGVIALATRNLPENTAKVARRVGIGLSLILKLVFIFITSLLFGITWLHIRVIGGVMLIYVTYNMLRQNEHCASQMPGERSGGDSFFVALISIIATDVSMSLDNVIAILSIVSSDGKMPGLQDMLVIIASLIVCVPVLLWFSGTISRLMERFPILIYLCAGYLVYTAVRMIFEDEAIALFLQYIGFTFTAPAAGIFGVVVIAASLFTGRSATPDATKKRRRIVPVYFFAVAYALVTVGMISYLSTGPVFDGTTISPELLYGFAAKGSNAIYIIGNSAHLFSLCACFLVAVIMDEKGSADGATYFKKWISCMCAMAVFILMYLTVCTIGMSALFGFGKFYPVTWFTLLLLQIVLNCSYISVFCMVRAFVKNRVAMVLISMMTVHIETEMVDLFMFWHTHTLLSDFSPGYAIRTLPDQAVNLHLLIRMLIIIILFIGISTWIGFNRTQKGRHTSKTIRV